MRFVAKAFAILMMEAGISVTSTAEQTTDPEKGIRYAVVGDSYSIGEGATPEQSWPALLARSLTKSGMPLELVSNPARTGWTTQDAIEREIPSFIAAKPDFATLQIGVNDWVQGVEAVTFRARLAQLMDAMLQALPDKKRLLVVNIPDFSVTPEGARYARGRDIAAGLTSFNQIIAEEARKRGLKMVDVFPVSQKMRGSPALVAADGLHPSAKAYAMWGELIFPAARELLGGCR